MLNLVDLRAGYAGREVLHGITARFETGENYCILGSNGCGKTTLVRAVAGLIESTGTVEIDGSPMRRMRRRELASKLAVMSQATSQYFPYTVFDTVMLGRYRQMSARLFARATAEDREKTEACLESVGLIDLRNRRIDELSGGQRQRVFLAQALAQDPAILLLDEPTNHLDIRHQIELVDYLHRWTASGEHSVIGVLHDINLALRLTDRILLMREGGIVADGRFSEVADAKLLKEIYQADIARFMRESFEKWRDLK